MDRRVLVTGHTGFKGAWLTLWLHSMGARVVGFSRDVPTQPSFYELAGVTDDAQSVSGDVADAETLVAVVTDFRPEVVFHLAAQSLVRRSYHDPMETYRTNVLGTVNILDAVRRTDSVRTVVCATSDKCYENRGWDWGYREIDPLGGADPYSSSKACADLVVSAYRSSYFDVHPTETAVSSVRAGNVIGGGDWAEDRLVPDLMRAVSDDRVLRLRNPLAERPWQHVLDCLSGYLLLAERSAEDPALAGAWNFGPDPDGSRSVQDVVSALLNRLGRSDLAAVTEASTFHEQPLLSLDSTKAKRRLGWYPRLGLEVALTLTAQWYAASASGADVRAVSLEQLAEFQGESL